MQAIKIYINIGFLLFLIMACKGNLKNQRAQQAVLPIKIVNQVIYTDNHSYSCKCAAQYDLKDSLTLTHIKNQFYKSKTGHLYEKTTGLKLVNEHLTDFEYFNGHFSQEVDPLTFEPLDGWYAKDKNNVYYYRPVSGGMQISKIDKADAKTFKMLAGHYKYGVDKNFYYDEPEIIKGFKPSKTKQRLDDTGQVIEIICGNKKFKFEL